MPQIPLAFGDSRVTSISSFGAELRLIPNFLPEPYASDLFRNLMKLPGWRQDRLSLFGKSVPIPRLHQWFSDASQPYTWSGLTMTGERFPRCLSETRRRLENETNVRFNSALANLYRDGRDSVSWHADDEPELGENPQIASLSLGATRRFLVRRKDDRKRRLTLQLEHGSLLLMAGATQTLWEHCIPKTKSAVGPRVNVTFRTILSSP